ncbi:MAG: hypothetical protein IJK91_08160 [Bacteroidales bacterium]|nr:hypothetical protein [Bacteroidales bacterium]
MKRIIINLFAAFITLVAGVSCKDADSAYPWGEAIVYMPQATYTPYEVPNNGSVEQTNRNYDIDEENRLLNIYLGVYRSGLQPLEAYTVSVDVQEGKLPGTTALIPAYYDLPMDVSCPAGQRDVSFNLSVDLDYLIANRNKVFSLVVYIYDCSPYPLNEDLTTTSIQINTKELLEKENL